MNKDTKNILKAVFEPFLNILAPKSCLVCSSKINSNNEYKYICTACLDSIPLAPKYSEITDKFSNKSNNPLPIDNFISLFEFNTDSNFYKMIYHLKYYGLYKAAEELGHLLARRLVQFGFTEYDLIVPVPVHKARKRERGYNQSDHIAIGISEAMSIPYDTQIISRIRYTQSQTQLNPSERKKNIKDSFKVNAGSGLNGKRILLVDDVLTTGSTLLACATELKSNSAEIVDAATLALTTH